MKGQHFLILKAELLDPHAMIKFILSNITRLKNKYLLNLEFFKKIYLFLLALLALRILKHTLLKLKYFRKMVVKRPS